MGLNFDIRCHLKPYEKVVLEFSEFKAFFVDPFDEDSSRHKLFRSYELYTQDLAEKITPNFTQWINGSFVTNKKNPRDIDLVNLIDYRIVEQKDALIRKAFIRDAVYERYGIDAYLLVLYPEDHKLHSWTQSDLLYWQDWFTKSKMDKRRKRYPKGYVAINIGDLNSES